VIAARWRPAALWTLLIEALILWPNPPEVPQGWSVVLGDFVKLDKLAHVALFAVLSVLLLRALVTEGRPMWIAFVACAAFGACTEVQQHFVPTRSMEFGDFLADAAGAAIGLAIFAAWALTRREFSR
jgi:VanZ family protein